MEINDIKESVGMNKGCDYGKSLIRHSVQKLGLTRSIVVDKDNVVLCGDKVLKACKDIGVSKVHVVETNGDTLVVVKRTDVDALSAKGCEISLVDNLSCIENTEWNSDRVIGLSNQFFGFNPMDWGGDACVTKSIDIEELLKQGTEIVEKKNDKKVFTNVYQQTLFD